MAVRKGIFEEMNKGTGREQQKQNIADRISSVTTKVKKPPGPPPRQFGVNPRDVLLKGSVGETPLAFKGIFRKGGEELDQFDINDEVITSGTRELAESFVDRFLEKTGNLPSEEQVNDFVAENLTSSFAREFILGATPRAQTKSKIVDPFLEKQGIIGGGGALSPGQIQERALGLTDRLKQILGQVEEFGVSSINRQFDPLERRVVSEEASRGRLRQPVARREGAPIQQIRRQRQEAISGLKGSLAGQRFGTEVDLAKFIEELLSGESQFGRRFGLAEEEVGLEREKFDTEKILRNKELNLSKTLGRLQAQNKKSGTMDKVKTGIEAAGTAAKIASLF